MTLLTPRPTYAPFEYPQAYKYWELQQQSHWLHCVARDQLVVTSNGLMTVEELYNNGESLTLFNNKEKIKSSPMIKTAFRQLFKIHTREGYTHSVTADHRVMTVNGWKEAKDLQEGDLLCIQTTEGLFGNINEPDLAYSTGLSQRDSIVEQTIPNFVLKGNKETITSYVKGLSYRSVICQTNLQFIQNLQVLLLNLGTKTHFYESIFSDNKYFLMILPKTNDIIYTSFSYLEKLTEEDVFCVSVDTDDHAWICNGFITHNTEIAMASDINDWKINLSETEKQVIGHILKGFTQSEVFIQEYWGQMVGKWFKKPEIQMMAATFSAFESIHAVSYAYLNQSLGLEDFDSFLHEPTAKAKIDRLINTKGKSKEEIAKSLAIFSAFNEGVNLFSSFAILLNFSRFNKLKGVGQIIAFSIKDESLHSEAGCWLFRTLISEFPELLNDELKEEIYNAARLTIELEDNFISKAFEGNPIEGITIHDLKNFIRHRANTKLGDLGLKKIWRNLDKEALERMSWFDVLSAGVSHADFFAVRVSDYSKGSIDFSTIWENNEIK